MNDVIRMVLVCVSGVLPKRFLSYRFLYVQRTRRFESSPPQIFELLICSSFFIPTITTFSMNPCMTRFAKDLQVLSVVCSALGQRLDVMYLLGWRVHPFSRQTSQSGWAAAQLSLIRFQALPYLLLVAGSRSYRSQRLASTFACSSQKRASVRLGQPG